MLCEVLKTGEQLIKLCDNQIFVKEFFLNGGLSLLMRIISGEGVHDVRKILLASIKIFLTLGDTTEDITGVSGLMFAKMRWEACQD